MTGSADVSVLAIDLGGSNGRGMLARFDGSHLTLTELSRFPNGPVARETGLHWDLAMLVEGVEAMIGAAETATGGRLASLGVDTWGLDYGLLDRRGELLGPPFAYRDGRTDGMVDRAAGLIAPHELYARTGSQTMPINTAFQLMSERRDPDGIATVLLMPDLIAYLLTGHIAAERTIASTTQLYDPAARRWADDVIAALGLDRAWFPDLVDPGVRKDPMLPLVAERAGVRTGLPVVRVAGHDTASAFAATSTGAGAYVISIGTWSLAGVERPAPLITRRSEAANLSNEAGVSGTIRLLKNAAGLWLLQECVATWGGGLTWDALAASAGAAPPHGALLDPDDPRLVIPGDMPARIRTACRDGGFPEPQTPGEHARVVLESLALRYRELVEEMELVTGQALPTIRVVGGGARNRLLCQLTADATGRPVVAGPVEATALGNAGVQLMALGHLAGLAELREAVARSVPVETYEPTAARGAWDDAYGRLRRLAGRDDLHVELGR